MKTFEEATLLWVYAVQQGLGGKPDKPGSPPIAAPQTAVVLIGGEKCKWRGSNTHAKKKGTKTVPTT